MTDKRQKYQTRAIILYDTSRDVALAMVRNAGYNITSERRDVLNQFGEPCRVAFYRLGK